MALNITGLPLTIISVSDYDAAIDFYCGKLGFEKVTEVPFNGDERWIEVAPKAGGHAIAFGKPPEGTPLGVMTGITVETTDIDADHKAMAEMGVDVDDEVMRLEPPVPPMFWFRDQDGNTLMLVESSPEG